MDTYSVYVDGNEINDYYLTIEQARELCRQFIFDGYTNVNIVKMK